MLARYSQHRNGCPGKCEQRHGRQRAIARGRKYILLLLQNDLAILTTPSYIFQYTCRFVGRKRCRLRMENARPRKAEPGAYPLCYEAQLLAR